MLALFDSLDISIHAPREGGDSKFNTVVCRLFLFQSTPPARGATASSAGLRLTSLFQSTPPARGATRRPSSAGWTAAGISIHAPREGGDGGRQAGDVQHQDFNPRPPRGGRRRWRRRKIFRRRFQSTPPARGATAGAVVHDRLPGISIHAPREGGDHLVHAAASPNGLFQSTPPARGATSTNLPVS